MASAPVLDLATLVAIMGLVAPSAHVQLLVRRGAIAAGVTCSLERPHQHFDGIYKRDPGPQLHLP